MSHVTSCPIMASHENSRLLVADNMARRASGAHHAELDGEYAAECGADQEVMTRPYTLLTAATSSLL